MIRKLRVLLGNIVWSAPTTTHELLYKLFGIRLVQIKNDKGRVVDYRIE